ncbi:unnamed protein product [Rotaria socialis]|uniref:Kinesin light chain n=1 Tax=Rotaria socialis TaxID=392032 RepID=A0A821QJ51_9BILA|nr:unnamed protein product [Rotaria socialis]CAF4826031.1 unnamed protein product [Rotaria socialis]
MAEQTCSIILSETGNTVIRRDLSVENFVLVWLCKEFDERHENVKHTLRQVISVVEIFREQNSCVDFITNNTDALVLFIANASDHVIVSAVHDFPQIKTIYLLSTSKPCVSPSIERCMKDHLKIKGIFSTIQAIVSHLKQDTKRDEHNMIGFEVAPVQLASTENNRNMQEASFMYAQLLKGILINMKDNDTSDMIEYCRQENASNKAALDIIQNFELNYRPERAIWWYSLDSFLYRMLNRALHVQDIDTLYHFRVFIRDMHRTVSQLHIAMMASNERKLTKLYRGQLIPSNDFEKIRSNVGGLLSINRFLSTSADRDLALVFAGKSTNDDTAVLLEISLASNHTDSSAPFAGIAAYSQFGSGEREYLFSMGTVFRIDRIEDIDHDCVCIHLTLTQDNDPQLTALANYMSIELHERYDLTTLGMFVLDIGDYHRAKQFFATALTAAKTPGHRVRCHNLLGMAYEKLGDYDKALEQFQLELKIHRQNLPVDHPVFAPTYSNIAVVYMDRGQLDLALKYFRRALIIEQAAIEPNYVELSVYHSHIGLILKAKGLLKESLVYQKKALSLRQMCLPPIHPSIAEAYNNLATIYYGLHQNDKAICMHKKSLEIAKKSLPTDDILLAVQHTIIGAILYSQDKLDDALMHFQESLRIKLKSLNPLHPEMAGTYASLGNIYNALQSYDKALEMYENTVKLYRVTLMRKHPEKLVDTMSSLIECLVKLGRTDEARERIREHYEWSNRTLWHTDEEARALQNILESILDKVPLIPSIEERVI